MCKIGQYYKPVVLSKSNEVIAWAYSHRFDNGLKLMEHSWIDNNFVDAFASLLTPEGPFHKSRVVWAGDYAQGEAGEHRPDSDFDDSYTHEQACEGEGCVTLYSKCEDENEVTPEKMPLVDMKAYPILVNHDKKLYIDLRNVSEGEDGDKWRIHPLPLLTSEGNGQGGGDYRGTDEQVGTWARDVISFETEAPEGYEETDGTFYE